MAFACEEQANDLIIIAKLKKIEYILSSPNPAITDIVGEHMGLAIYLGAKYHENLTFELPEQIHTDPNMN